MLQYVVTRKLSCTTFRLITLHCAIAVYMSPYTLVILCLNILYYYKIFFPANIMSFYDFLRGLYKL